MNFNNTRMVLSVREMGFLELWVQRKNLGFHIQEDTKLQLQLAKLQYINLRTWFVMECVSYWFDGGKWLSGGALKEIMITWMLCWACCHLHPWQDICALSNKFSPCSKNLHHKQHIFTLLNWFYPSWTDLCPPELICALNNWFVISPNWDC